MTGAVSGTSLTGGVFAVGGGGSGGSAVPGGSSARGGAAGGGSEPTGGSSSTGGTPGWREGCKRGVAYGYHSEADLAALSTGVSWWYNWDFLPDAALRDGTYRDYDVEYVPMIWGVGSDRVAAASAIPDNARALLGFNEPNFGSQANLSATDAAALWPELEAIAEARGLMLVSPAVNYCGGDCQDTDPFRYLTDFLAACVGCRVDALAIHVYVGCSPSGDNQAAWLIDHVERYKSEFTLPLWLTEFACDDATSEDDQIAFMTDAVDYLENEPRIARYAWFAGRANNVPHVDLLGVDGQLTALGRSYLDQPQPARCLR